MKGKKYSKVGNKKGQPAFRTTSNFIYRRYLESKKAVANNKRIGDK